MEETNTKEINLLQLIGLLYDWVKKVILIILSYIGHLVKLTYKYKIMTLILIVICVAAGLYLSRPSARIYKAEAMAMLYGSEAQTVKEICKQLENASANNNDISLATKLSIPDSVAKNIAGISSYYVVDYLKDGVADKIDFANNHSLTDTLNLRMRDRIYLQIQTTNIRQVPFIQDAIMKYFNNNEIMKSDYMLQIRELAQRINICSRENLRIDSLAKVSYFNSAEKQLSFDKNTLLVGEQKKQLFYNELLDLQNNKANAEILMSRFKSPMVLPSGFVVNPIPVNSRFKYGVYGIFIGYALALILSVFIDNLKKMKSFLNN